MAAADAKTDAPKARQPLGSRSGKRGYIRICVICGRQLRGVGSHTKYCRPTPAPASTTWPPRPTPPA